MKIFSMFKMFKSRMLLNVVLLVLFAGAAGGAFYFYNQFNELKMNPQKIAQAETDALLREIGKIIVLPQGEQPVVATVSDPAALAAQPFFQNAKKGDKVLIYTDSKKAILYDPVAKRIIEVAPVNVGAATEGTTPGGGTTPQ